VKKRVISLSEIANQILLERRIVALFENAAGMASSIQSQVMEFGKEMKAAGEDPTDEEAQAALLMAAIKNGGNLDKVSVEDAEQAASQVKESRGYTLNEGGGILHAIEVAGSVLGNVALLNTIAKAIEKATGKKIDTSNIASKVNYITGKLKKLTGLPAKAMEAFFALISKKLGGGAQAQKIAGFAGTYITVIALFLMGAAFFPVLGGSPLMIILSLTGLIGKGFELVHLFKELQKAFDEYEPGQDAKVATA
jgi:hypothetical protein